MLTIKIRNDFNKNIRYKQESNIESNLKIGDIVKFVGGYNSDMIFETEIIGFDKDGLLYVLWEAYWCSINPTRFIN